MFFNFRDEKKSKYALSDSEDEEDSELRKKIELKLKEKEVDEEAVIEQRRRERELILAKYKDQAPVSVPASAAPALAPAPAPVAAKLTVARPVVSKPSSPVVRGTPKTLTPIMGSSLALESGNRSPEILAADYNDSDVLKDATHKSEKIKVDWAQVSDDDSSDEEGGAKHPKNDTPELEHTAEVEEEEDAEALVGVLPKGNDPTVKDRQVPAFEDDMFAAAPAEDDMFAQFDSNKKLVAKMVKKTLLFLSFF